MISTERLYPDPSVALCAYRFPSESKPGTFHDAALMLGENVECPAWPSGNHKVRAERTRIVCISCRAVLRWWSCDCWPGLKHGGCPHIAEAIGLYAAERRAEPT